ncbi:ArsR/SmtB family transcription factor [Janibacter limosus]|uniref:ArsR/SmtB family transcription factor n=1 Tax=Janibacter limosus TaxID=53458 RepID=UPI000A0355BE
MTSSDEDRADAFFHALADSTRRDILRRVLAGEHSVSALAAHHPMSFAAVQKHVAALERAGLITKRRSGRESLASGDVEAVRAVGAMLTELEDVWRGRVAGIDALLANDNPADTHTTWSRRSPCPSPMPRSSCSPSPPSPPCSPYQRCWPDEPLLLAHQGAVGGRSRLDCRTATHGSNLDE